MFWGEFGVSNLNMKFFREKMTILDPARLVILPTPAPGGPAAAATDRSHHELFLHVDCGQWWCGLDCHVPVALDRVLLVRVLVGEDPNVPVLHVVHAGPGSVTHTVQDLIIPALYRGLQVLERSSQISHFVYLGQWEVGLIECVEDVYM